MSTLIYVTTNKDPYSNLAFEEYLCRICGNDLILFLWQNDNTIVIGRNQNAWAECSQSAMQEDDVKLARRTTGGGAVYHDLGNLNFSFIFPSSTQDKDKGYAVIMDALNTIGIPVIRSGRNDLTTTDGRKFSGNAFRLKDGIFLHHGTLLIASETGKMEKYLNPSFEKLNSKGIDSVKARVVNLSELKDSLTIEAMKIALIGAMNRLEPGAIRETDYDIPEVQAIRKELSDPIWLYEKNSKADVTLSHRFTWGGVELLLIIRDSKIAEITVYTDSMDPELSADIERILTGCEFLPGRLSNQMRGSDLACKEELADWLKELSL